MLSRVTLLTGTNKLISQRATAGSPLHMITGGVACVSVSLSVGGVVCVKATVFILFFFRNFSASSIIKHIILNCQML